MFLQSLVIAAGSPCTKLDVFIAQSVAACQKSVLYAMKSISSQVTIHLAPRKPNIYLSVCVCASAGVHTFDAIAFQVLQQTRKKAKEFYDYFCCCTIFRRKLWYNWLWPRVETRNKKRFAMPLSMMLYNSPKYRIKRVDCLARETFSGHILSFRFSILFHTSRMPTQPLSLNMWYGFFARHS